MTDQIDVDLTDDDGHHAQVGLALLTGTVSLTIDQALDLLAAAGHRPMNLETPQDSAEETYAALVRVFAATDPDLVQDLFRRVLAEGHPATAISLASIIPTPNKEQ